MKHFEKETSAFGRLSGKFHLYLPPFEEMVDGTLKKYQELMPDPSDPFFSFSHRGRAGRGWIISCARHENCCRHGNFCNL